jgi:hypothetical protein
VEIVWKAKGRRRFAVVPWRWIVERTFAWPGRYRRLKSDYERLPEDHGGHHSHRHDSAHGTPAWQHDEAFQTRSQPAMIGVHGKLLIEIAALDHAGQFHHAL